MYGEDSSTMVLSILTDATKAKLEQERSRLKNERDAIIEAAVAQATSEIDRVLQQINRLLGNDAPASTANIEASPRSKSKQSKQAVQPISKATPTSQKSKAKPKSSATSTVSKASKSTTASQPLPPKARIQSIISDASGSANPGESR